jgi:NAD(P)-dependent dehydrogenase (short-subunit alcohol dehydrogenase family)
MRSVIVTGAAGGIGKSLCEVFHSNGYGVIGIDKQEIRETLPYRVLRFDISRIGRDKGETDAFFGEVEGVLAGKLDVLVNNAAVQVVKGIEEVNAADWKETLDTNLLAPFWLIQRFLPFLRNARGSVINIASIHAMQTKPRFSVYATSKGALTAMTRALAVELAPEIRINAIIPAATDTPMLRAGFGTNTEGLVRLGEYHPLGRIAQPEEVAKVALFLAGSDSSFITGSTLHVDGGIGAVLHDPVIAR